MHRIIDLYSYHFIWKYNFHRITPPLWIEEYANKNGANTWADNGPGSGQRADSALSRWQKEAWPPTGQLARVLTSPFTRMAWSTWSWAQLGDVVMSKLRNTQGLKTQHWSYGLFSVCFLCLKINFFMCLHSPTFPNSSPTFPNSQCLGLPYGVEGASKKHFMREEDKGEARSMTKAYSGRALERFWVPVNASSFGQADRKEERRLLGTRETRDAEEKADNVAWREQEHCGKRSFFSIPLQKVEFNI